MSENEADLPPTPAPFRLGLTFAGAVSAGAYSAGVLDFLREALEAWEAAKRNGGSDSQGCAVPTHSVQIQAISGTSAGAMCAAMFIGGLDKPLAPIRQLAPALADAAKSNPLYYAWVSRVDIKHMLTDDDLVKGGVKSLLNCRILDEIAGEVLNPWRTDYSLQPWLAPDAEVFLCTTSLRGIPYAAATNTVGQPPYGMSLHSGILKYRLVNSYTSANSDGEALAPDAPAANWSSLRNAALASGAFPFALKARQTLTPRATIERRRWEVPEMGGRTLAENIQSELGQELTVFRAICVDGGVINNEPFEHVRLALSLANNTVAPGETIRSLERDIRKSNAATILIDPFPDDVEFDTHYPTEESANELLAVTKSLLPAVLDQLRFKADELALAAQSKIGSRYLISPSRHKDPGADKQPTLACGELGGFCGFLHEAFRHHDYMLGRLNCQRFLARHFYVDSSNPLITAWLSGNPDSAYAGSQYYPANEIAAIGNEQADIKDIVPVPVIPLMPHLRDRAAVLGEGNTSLPWPSVYTEQELQTLKRSLRNRFDAVLTKMVDKFKLGIFREVGRWLMSGVATIFGINPANIASEEITKYIRKKFSDAGLLKKR